MVALADSLLHNSERMLHFIYHWEQLNLFAGADHSLSSALVPTKGLPRQNDEKVGSVMRGGGAAHARDKRVGESRHAA